MIDKSWPIEICFTPLSEKVSTFCMLLVDIIHALLEGTVLRELKLAMAIIAMGQIDPAILDRVVLNFTLNNSSFRKYKA